MSDTFADPVQPGQFKPEEWVGHLLLIEAQRYGDPIPTRFGMSGYVEARVHVLTAQPQEVIDQARLFGSFESNTRSEIGGKPVLGRVESFVSQQSGRNGYRLGDSSPEDKQYADGYWQQWKAQHPTTAQPAQQYGAPVPLPNSQPQGYGAPSPQDQQWATQQAYAPPGVTTNVVPNMDAPSHREGLPSAPAPVPTPAPQPPAPAPAQATPPVPVTPAGPVAQAGAQPPASSVPEMDDEQFKGMPEDVQKLLDAARYARLHSA